MTAIKKLTLTTFLAVCALCLTFGIAGCNSNEQQHQHTFSEDWVQTATEHWHAATCDHATQKSSYGKHADTDNDGYCDKCGYSMHTHIFDTSYWEHDTETHWHKSICGHDEVRGDEAQHFDLDGNQYCDECEEYIAHQHKFSETEWEFNEIKHWRPSTCGHPVKDGETSHTFEDGECECGVKESEVDVYNALKALEMTDNSFTDWRTAIKADQVTSVRLSELGDIIYDRNGVAETKYIADRTIKIKASTGADGIPDVWFKVSVSENGSYKIVEGGTNALAVAKTDSNGIAELTFTPVDGYSNGNSVKYEIILAEAKDVVAYKGGDESEIKIYPAKYEIKGKATGLAIVGEITVNEDNVLDGDISGELEFEEKENCWENSDKFTLPYVRYYTDSVNGTGLTEDGFEYSFTASGLNFYDYFYFKPSQRYNWSQGSDTSDFDNITKNFKIAASGVYRIYFEADNAANVRLYLWDEGGVELDAYYIKSSDGSNTPDSSYITSVSGNVQSGVSSADKYTGGNYVDVTVSQNNGLRQFQLGIVSDIECEITFTVQRIKDYVIDNTIRTLTLGENNVPLKAFDTTQFRLSGLTAGLYTIQHKSGSYKDLNIGVMYAWITEADKAMMWREDREARYKYEGVLRIPASAEYLYVWCGCSDPNGNPTVGGIITLSRYEESPEIALGETTILASGRNSEKIYVPTAESLPEGTYGITVTTYGTHVGGGAYEMTIEVGDNEYVINNPTMAGDYTIYEYMKVAKINAGDRISVRTFTPFGSFFVNVKLESFDSIELNKSETIEFKPNIWEDGTWFGVISEYHIYTFAAEQAGKYRLHIELLDDKAEDNKKSEYPHQNERVGNLNALEICNVMESQISTNTQYMYFWGEYDTTGYNISYSTEKNKQTVSELDIDFDLDSGEGILFNIYNILVYMKISVTLQYVD